MSRRRRLRAANLALSLAVAAGLLYVASAGIGPLPAFGRVLEPVTGVWTAATDALGPQAQTLRLDGLQQPVRVDLDAAAIPTVHALSDRDAMLALGYLHARYRILQMDVSRRQGEGRLAQVFGPPALESDRFELDLGLVRTAAEEWRQMQPEERQFLTAYAQGVNDRIREDLATSNLPMLFKLEGYEPQPWTPLDSLIVKGVETQSLDFQEGPLLQAQLVHALGPERAAQWFPTLPLNEQHPYDPGPYTKLPAAPLRTLPVGDGEATAAAALAARIADLPAGLVASGGNSNNWAVDGKLTASGKPLMAGDPHLDLTLPSIWYRVAVDAPSLSVEGVTIPGEPVVVIGRNGHLSWSETNTQNQATLYYREQTDPDRPGQYFWKGTWRRFSTVAYDIPVRDAATEHRVVQVSVHGPVMTVEGETLAVDWIGAVPSDDGQVLLDIARASSYAQFREALRGWHAPAQNFVYADDAGNIGLISAGYYPLLDHADPSLPLPGSGEADVVGSIPFEAVPQVYDPPTHYVFSANQRPVAATYPYYIGDTLSDFDAGYRAAEIQRVLSAGKALTVADMERLQNDDRDYLAGLIVPRLLDALGQTELTPDLDAARELLRSWDGVMSVGSAAAAIWWSFWQAYRDETFGPWWSRYRVPVDRNRVEAALDEDLEAWTLHDPANAAFSPPEGVVQTASDVMVKAFANAVDRLARELGSGPRSWSWGRIHTRTIGSLYGVRSLGYGPRPAGGDAWTVDAARGGNVLLGPSFRFVVDWSSGQAWAALPGGQSENAVSDWYADGIPGWWRGAYAAMARPAAAAWQLQP